VQTFDSILPLPAQNTLSSLSELLLKQIRSEEIHRRYAPVKHILALVGVAGVVGLSFVAPTAVLLAKPFVDEQRKKHFNAWKHYNPSYLRASLRRLHKQKLVEIVKQNGEEVVSLTESGKRRIIKYALNDLTIETPKHWDGRWRIIIYDVENKKKRLRDIFRGALKSLGFLQLQESVWIYPYSCEKQITFLKEYYGVGKEVLYIVAVTLEDDSPYKTYFGLE